MIATKCDKHKKPFFSRCRQCIEEEKEQYAKEMVADVVEAYEKRINELIEKEANTHLELNIVRSQNNSLRDRVNKNIQF